MHRRPRPLTAVCLALALASSALPARAGDLSDAELLRLFTAQRDAFRAAAASPTGQTRGLTLMTVEDVAVEAATQSPALGAPQGGDVSALVPDAGKTGISAVPSPDALTAPAADTGATVSAAAQPLQPLVPQPAAATQDVVFGELAPELQVNVNIRFGFDSAALSDDQKPLLDQLCKVMKASDIKLFRIVGHTDSAGGDEYNERLSNLRAQEVQRHLVNECGIAPDRLEAIGLGERFLTNKGDPKAPENRRVEFQALS